MRDRDSTRPFVFFFLVLPYGISSEFVSITLPFVLTRVGNLGGNGIGGGVGVWLASHFSKQIAGGGLAIAMFASAAAIYFVSDVRVVANETFGERMRICGAIFYRSCSPLFRFLLSCLFALSSALA